MLGTEQAREAASSRNRIRGKARRFGDSVLELFMD
jgi:hypothetical protein